MKKLVYPVVFIFSLVCLVYAEEPITKLEEVVVTATTTEVPVERLPVNVQVITREEIEQSTATNLGDLLAEKLAGHIHKYPGLLTSVGIRGFRTDTHGTDIKGRVLVLVDGHRAGTGNVAEIPLDNVERIEIVRGPASVIYGSAAMGGVINIITRKGKGKPTVFAGIEYGSWDYNRQYAGSYGQVGKFNYSFSISKEQRNDYKAADDITREKVVSWRPFKAERDRGKEIDNTDFHSWMGSFRIGLEPIRGHEISVVGQFTEFWRVGSPGSNYSFDKDDYKDIRRKYISVAYDAKWNKRVSTHLSYYYVQDSNEWHDPSEAWGFYETKTITNTQGIRARVIISPFSILRITAGFDWDGIRVKNAKYPSDKNIPYTPNSAYDNYAGYLQAELTWSRLYILAGMRYDYWEEELRPTQNMALKSDEEDYDHVTWRVGASYKFLDWLKVRAAVGTAFRTPTADELSGYFERGWWGKIVGNPGLDPETSVTYEIGLDIIKNSLKSGIGYFYTRYDDRIAGGFPACVDGDCTWTTYKNVDGAVIEGVEFYASYDFGELFKLPFVIEPYINGIKYIEYEIKDNDFAKELGTDDMPYISHWNVTGGLNIGVPEKIMGVFSFFYVGRQKVQEWNYFKPDYRMAKEKGGFTVFNAKVTWYPCKYAKLFVGIENIFNKQYSFVDYYPMPGRTWKVGLEVKF